MLAFDVIHRGVILMGCAFCGRRSYAVSYLMSTSGRVAYAVPGGHEHCRQNCIGPPAPKNGAIRMTKRNGVQQFLNRSRRSDNSLPFFAPRWFAKVIREKPCLTERLRDFHSDVTSSDRIGVVRAFAKITRKAASHAGLPRNCM